MLLWGALWSHAHLVLVPAMAGTVTAQTGTFLACFAIAVATASAVTAVERGTVPRGFRTTTLLLGAGVGLAGIPLALIRSGSLAGLCDLLGLLVIADLCMVALYLGWAWRRGRSEEHTSELQSLMRN